MAMQPSGPVDCRVAIVTGGSRGIGRAAVHQLARIGYAVVVNYVHDQGTAEAVVEAVLADRGAAVAVRADVADEFDVKRLFVTTIEAFGSVDAVVHAVRGEVAAGPVADTRLGDFDAMVRTGTRAGFLVIREAARHVQSGGAIVALTGAASDASLLAYGAYATTAAGINLLCQSVALELEKRDIAVNTVSLEVDTPCEPVRVAEAIGHLLSDAGHGITGQVLRVDEFPPGWNAATADR